MTCMQCSVRPAGEPFSTELSYQVSILSSLFINNLATRISILNRNVQTGHCLNTHICLIEQFGKRIETMIYVKCKFSSSYLHFLPLCTPKERNVSTAKRETGLALNSKYEKMNIKRENEHMYI